MSDNQFDVDRSELADDVMRTANSLMGSIDEPDDSDPAPMGMNPLAIADMLKPKVRQRVMESPEDAIGAMAVLQMASKDVLQKHVPDEDWVAIANAKMQERHE